MARLGVVANWGALVAITLASVAVVENLPAARWAGTAAVVFAVVKGNLIVARYMEVGWAPQPLRLILSGWLLLVGALLCGALWW